MPRDEDGETHGCENEDDASGEHDKPNTESASL